MQIAGYQKTTLLDYPGHLAATIFTGGCNFRCPFCHNKDLVLQPQSQPTVCEDEIYSFLRKRKGILQAVCITGGEPTLQSDLPDFIRRIRELGYLIKLDTNGYRPDVLERLLKDHLLDYIAMDIKTCPEKYACVASVSPFQFSQIAESTDLIRTCRIPYEFRTTVVRELHTEQTLLSIGKWLEGSAFYALQAYQDSDTVISPGFHSYSAGELKKFAELLQSYIPNTIVRGTD